MDWKSKIRDPKEREVFEALSNPEWDFRTAPGISKSIGLSEREVKNILAKYPDLIRKSPIPDQRGHELFTLRSRPRKAQELMAELRSFVTKSTQ
jgi:hypothetical protein